MRVHALGDRPNVSTKVYKDITQRTVQLAENWETKSSKSDSVP